MQKNNRKTIEWERLEISSRKIKIHSYTFLMFKETFHTKMNTIKDKTGTELKEAEDIKKRWQEYTEELFKNDLHDPDNYDGVITHLEPDILECEV